MYAERLIYLNPNFLFNKLALRQQVIERQGWTDLTSLQIPSIIVLKQSIMRFPIGTKFWWACGDIDDMDAFQAFGPKAGRLKGAVYYTVVFLPPRALGDENVFDGIDFESDAPSENSLIARYPAKYFVSNHIPRSACALGNEKKGAHHAPPVQQDSAK